MNTTSDRAPVRVLVLSTTLPRTAAAAGQARAFVTKALAAWHVGPALADDLLLAVSELVTNAVEHGDGEVRLRLRNEGAAIHLRVGDQGGGTPVVHPFGPRSERSRGLAIVQALSTDWGWCVDAKTQGKWVWASFAFDQDDDD